MRNFSMKICLVLALILLFPIFAFTACSDPEPANPDDGGTPPTEESGKPTDENLFSPIKSGIYYFEKENLSLSDMFFIDSGERAMEHFDTKDINGIRTVISNNEEKYGFSKFAESITKDKNLRKCVEFNTRNQVSTYVINSGFYTRQSSFKYTYGDSVFTNNDSDAPFISYNEKTGTLSLIYKFYYFTESGSKVFPYVYIKVNMVYQCESLDMMTGAEGMKNFVYKANTAKVVNSDGVELNKDHYKTAIINTFKLEAETENPIQAVESLISGYKVTVGSSLLTVLTKDDGSTFKFSFNSISNSSIVIGGIAYNITSDISNLYAVTEATVRVSVGTGVFLQFQLKLIV